MAEVDLALIARQLECLVTDIETLAKRVDRLENVDREVRS
jgi:hypothetical protein